MAKPDRSFLVTYPRHPDGFTAVRDRCEITGETFFFARAQAALLWGVEPGEIRIAGGRAGGA